MSATFVIGEGLRGVVTRVWEKPQSLDSFTKGPWKVSFESVDPDWAVVTAAGGKIIANVNGANAANANLIKAAPDMLRALQMLADTGRMEDSAWYREAIDARDAAIALATGRAS